MCEARSMHREYTSVVRVWNRKHFEYLQQRGFNAGFWLLG